MAGSQLKNLRKALKDNGLTGQSNVKGSKKSKKQSREYDREERAKTVARIREQFNPFDVKVNRDKRSTHNGGEQRPVGKPGISKQIGEEQRQKAHELRKGGKNKLGGVFDRRFGEKDKTMTAEEKMLERFTRERQNHSGAGRSIFNLEDGDDDGDMYGEKLTHFGKSLALEDDFDRGDLGLHDEDDAAMLEKRAQRTSKRLMDEELLGDEEPQPERKKTKAEVMKEVIAKSKFYKQERQKAQEQLEDQIDNLDNDFDDILSQLHSVPEPARSAVFDKNHDADKEYDMKVKELILERRAAPADRTKTEEEIKSEQEQKRLALEQDRLNRMAGMLEEDRGVEDLGDEFWRGSDSEHDGMGVDDEGIADSDDDVSVSVSDDERESRSCKNKAAAQFRTCPSTHEELLAVVNGYKVGDHSKIVKDIIKACQPRLAEGNKQRLGKFTGVLLYHIMFLASNYGGNEAGGVGESINSLVSILRNLAQKYNEPLSLSCRDIIQDIHLRFKTQQLNGLSRGDLIFFATVGTIFSASDHYHLVITPCNIVIGEILEQTKPDTLQKLLFCIILCKIFLKYQRLSKRFSPELVFFLERAIMSLLPSSQGTDTYASSKSALEVGVLPVLDPASFASAKSHPISLNTLSICNRDITDDLKKSALSAVINLVDETISLVWKELSAFPEIISRFEGHLATFRDSYEHFNSPSQILQKIDKLKKNREHIPLALQNHRPVGIPSHTPKFEENFNPEKRSYDVDSARNEMNKMKAQLRKERKFTMKEIRKDTKFEARQQIDTKKRESAEYHAKMARIINTISTEEGAEKSKYEREKKLRNAKK